MKNLKKCSFTLIELVFAMVIIGISVASIPMLLSTVSQNSSTSLKSNSFYNAYSTLALIESMYWDENNTKGDNYKKVLTANGGDSKLRCIRQGTKQLDNESGAECDDNTTSAIGIDSGENKNYSTTFDDVDDFDGYELETGDYNIFVSVKYVKDDFSYSDSNNKNIFYDDTLTKKDNTNLKLIEIKVKDKNNGKLISIIRGKSANIGRVKMYSRSDL